MPINLTLDPSRRTHSRYQTELNAKPNGATVAFSWQDSMQDGSARVKYSFPGDLVCEFHLAVFR